MRSCWWQNRTISPFRSLHLITPARKRLVYCVWLVLMRGRDTYCNRTNFHTQFNFVLAESTKFSSIRKPYTYTSASDTTVAVRKFLAYESRQTRQYEIFTHTKISAITVVSETFIGSWHILIVFDVFDGCGLTCENWSLHDFSRFAGSARADHFPINKILLNELNQSSDAQMFCVTHMTWGTSEDFTEALTCLGKMISLKL